MNQRAGRLGIGIIGGGHVGPVLGAALAGAGHAIIGVHAVSERSRDRVEAILPGVPILDIPALIERSELVILAIPADQIAPLVTGLAEAGVWQAGTILMHTAAEYGVEVLAPAAARGVIPIALHPAMVFSGTSMDLARLAETYVAVTAPTPVQPIGQALAVEMGAEPVIVAEADRARYAEAIMTATEFSRSIVGQSTALLREIGIESPGGYLSSLVRSAVDLALTEAGERPRPFLD